MRRYATAWAMALGLALIVAACGASPSVVRAVEARDATTNAGGTGGGGVGSSANALGSGASGGGGIGAGTSTGGAADSSGAIGSGAGSGGGSAIATAGQSAIGAGGPAGATGTAADASGSASSSTGSASGSGGGGAGTTSSSACGAAAPAGGNGGATDTGVSATSIKIGGTFFNGSYLDKYSQVTENAAKAYFDYVNDSGGICGRQIDYITCDTAGTADGTTGCLSTLADQDNVFIMGPSLDFNLDIVEPKLAAEKLPWVGDSGLYPQEFESPWMFPTQISGEDVGALITEYSANVLHLKKVGISLLDEVAGPDCTKQAQIEAKTLGIDASATASNGEIETALDSQVSTLRNAGVQAVLFCNDPVNTIKFIQAAQRAGWHPTFVGGFVAADDVPQAAGPYAAGMYGFTSFDFYDENTPGIEQYRTITQYYFPNTFHHFYEQAAYVGAEAVVAALRQAGPDLTRTDFLTALKSMTNFDTGMGLHLDFANLAGAPPSGIMIQADDNLDWHVVSARFGLQ
jgi:ABC-type branched-subunit amino acid transport system substrate-binding protein